MRLVRFWRSSTAGDSYFYDLDEDSFWYEGQPTLYDHYGVLRNRLHGTASKDYWEWIPEL